jgi:LAO/AO transport system kinase
MTEIESSIWPSILRGDFRALARAISYIENGIGDFHRLLMEAPPSPAGIIGITGPPGAGKSTLVDALIGQFVAQQKKVAVLCIDPSSSFHSGALLGDRIRMSDWYSHPDVFIRSLSSKGQMGGLHPAILEIADLMKAAGFDHVLIETVGVGQSEVEIAALADTTVLVLVPEAGDDIQMMKVGIMEIADIFVVNKADRPDADLFIGNLRSMQTFAPRWAGKSIPIVKTIASQKQGVAGLATLISEALAKKEDHRKKYRVLAERAYLLIQRQKMKGISRAALADKIEEASAGGEPNLYRLIREWL